MSSSSSAERSAIDATPPVADPTQPLEALEDEPVAPGDRIARYVVTKRLGAGGMGVVYAAYDPQLDRQVALKLLLSEHGRRADARRTRLLREAQAMAKLSHENVVGVLDVGEHGDRVFLAMEYVEARTLDAWIAETRPTWRQILAVFQQAGRGLVAAHQAGLVHRDFKPSNVLIGHDGHVRVGDFGLARPLVGSVASDAVDEPAVSIDGEDLSHLTNTGAAIGTPAYMAPEQHLRRPADERSDQFSFCVALFESLYGLPPFDGDDRERIADEVVAGRVRQPPWDTKAPAWIWEAIRRGLLADPSERFASMQELLDALRADPGRRRRAIVLASLGGVGVLALTAIAAERLMPTEPDCAQPPCVGDVDGSAAEPSADPQRSALTEEARLRIHNAEGLLATSRLEDARREIDAAMRAAESLDDGSLVAAVALQDAALAEERADWEGARKALERAYFTAQKVAANAEAVDAATRLAAIVGVRFAEHDEADEWLRHARAALERLGSDVRREAAVLAALAEIHHAKGEYEQALQGAREGLALLQDVAGAEALVARLHNVAGTALSDLGRVDLARAEFETVLAIREALYGRDHPQVARALNNVATTERAAGNDTAALAAFRRAAEILERALGPEHPSLAVPLANLANLHRDRDEPAEARRDEDRAYRIALAAGGPEHPDTLRNRVARAVGLLRDGDLDAAGSELQACVRAYETLYGEHPAQALPLSALAQIELDRGHALAAVPLARRAVDIVVAAARDDDPLLAQLEITLARALWDSGHDRADAIVRMRRAKQILQRAAQQDSEALVFVRDWLAEHGARR